MVAKRGGIVHTKQGEHMPVTKSMMRNTWSKKAYNAFIASAELHIHV